MPRGDLARVEAALAARRPRVSRRVTRERAAVLIPISEDESGRIYVWLTKRSLHMRSNPGEMSFPGGKREEQDTSDEYTALRETHEEIGLDPASVRVIGQLDPLVNRVDVLVVAFVGVIPHSFQPAINHNEVDRVVRMPLDYLLDPQAARRHIDWLSEDNEPRRSYFFEYDGEDVWGLTLEFLFHFIEASKFGRIPFQWQLPNQPTWFDRSLL